ncbi:MAG: hypothetical protein WBN04_02880 [Paracoccaceae bacterium]
MRTLVLLALMALPAAAQGLRTSDTELDVAALTDALSGQLLEFFDGSKSRYYPDGDYLYTYTDDGEQWNGTYILAPDGSVCVQMEVGGSRCDTYVLADGRLTLIIKNGTRFPVRSATPLE